MVFINDVDWTHSLFKYYSGAYGRAYCCAVYIFDSSGEGKSGVSTLTQGNNSVHSHAYDSAAGHNLINSSLHKRLSGYAIHTLVFEDFDLVSDELAYIPNSVHHSKLVYKHSIRIGFREHTTERRCLS
jgi:hypothetical protein